MKYELNKLYNEDCLPAMREMPDKYFELAIVDPPYFPEANLHYHNGAEISGTNVRRNTYHKSSSWNVPSDEYYQELCRVSVHQIIWGINYFDFIGVPPGRIVWDKQRAGLIGSFSDAELASCSLIKGIRMFRYMWDGMLQGNMKNKEKKIHITQKPVALYEWLLNNYAKYGDKILDTHVGSASSLVACHKLGFDYMGFEIDNRYFELASERLEMAKNQISLFDVDLNSHESIFGAVAEQRRIDEL